ncbi:MAG: nucleoside 2-deoxyribosyltransferase [Muribaculaceae bacterium]|nr:nucleoside 2-deoxyribosyltransferase [Muribaculaceae bacterium]
MVLLIGDILIDVSLSHNNSEDKMRLGGIIHAARALWALGIEYGVAYFAPDYLDEHIIAGLKEYKCKEIIKLGHVIDNPYVILIKEAREIGNQGYDFLCRESINIKYIEYTLNRIKEFEKILIISGNFDLKIISNYIKDDQKVSLDFANNVKSVEDLPSTIKYDTLFLSSSSDIFKRNYFNFEDFKDLFEKNTHKLVVKENRGGSIGYIYESKKKFDIPCFITPIIHSVGVGDVFDIVSFVSNYNDFEDRLYYASWIAQEYAKTTFVNEFKLQVERSFNIEIEDLKQIEGCFLPWEERKKCQIYIAAPDFDYVDTGIIDKIEECLKYHNFDPKRPIKLNGQLSDKPTMPERKRLFNKDMNLLNSCNALIGIYLYDDPGTFIEMAITWANKKPVILFDPKMFSNNCMLVGISNKIICDLDSLIDEIFRIYSKMYKNGTL